MTEQNENPKYGYAVKALEIINIPFPVAANMTWDSYWRMVHDNANKVIQKQADKLVQWGNVTWEESRQLVEVQRN